MPIYIVQQGVILFPFIPESMLSITWSFEVLETSVFGTGKERFVLYQWLICNSVVQSIVILKCQVFIILEQSALSFVPKHVLNTSKLWRTRDCVRLALVGICALESATLSYLTLFWDLIAVYNLFTTRRQCIDVFLSENWFITAMIKYYLQMSKIITAIQLCGHG